VWGNSPRVRIPSSLPETLETPIKSGFQTLSDFKKFKCPTSVQQNQNKYLYKRNNIYYFCKRINNKVVKISLKSANLEYCQILKNQILDKLNMKKEEEKIISKVFEKEKDYKKVIKAELNPNMEFDGETLEKILELGIRALGKNSNYTNLLQEKQLTEQTIYKISDKNDLERIAQKIDNLGLVNKVSSGQIMNFETLYNEFIEKKEADNDVGIESYQSYQATFNFVKDFFQDKNLNELNYKNQDDLKIYLQNTQSKGKLLSKVTLNNHIQTLSSFFKFGEDRELLDKNFLKNIKSFKEENIEKYNYTDEQLLKILSSDIHKFNAYTKQRELIHNYCSFILPRVI
jgi:hypothetical protein